MNHERIEEIREKRFKTVITAEELYQLATLALRGLSDRSPSGRSPSGRSLPKVEWAGPDPDNFYTWYCVLPYCDMGIRRIITDYVWSISYQNGDSHGHTDSLEAAQKAAEDALAKLVGGEE